ncbi:glycosyltransferase family 2 protein [Rhodopseudomonas sp. G2_2311]|uniref:glycosyltransferase family 2 protein n=1 Tax=Rhodopseudomonas sp. G2_2311 TaxID=3114287 RepID=UPI0039C718FE
MHNPLLSIVMPTHNRYRYASHALHSLLSLKPGPDILEIVVHDTSTSFDLRDWVASSCDDDQRLHYVHSAELLDLTQNHNRALAMASGRYLCLIGDDDTVLPDLLELADYADKHNIDCIAPQIVANYAWPDFVSRTFGTGHAGRLYVKRKYGAFERKLTEPALNASLARAAQGTDGLPKLYHGLVKRRVMEVIRSKTGDYVHGASPDVSAALAIAATIESFVEIDFPVTLPGASGGSNTGASAMGQHKGDLANTRQTSRYAANWPALVPPFYSVETVWAHAAFETLRLLNHPALKQFNYPELYMQCLIRHRREVDHTFQSMKAYQRLRGTSTTELSFMCISSAASIIMREAMRLAIRATRPTAAGNRRHFGALATIAEAQTMAVRIIASDDVGLATLLGNQEGPQS